MDNSREPTATDIEGSIQSTDDWNATAARTDDSGEGAVVRPVDAIALAAPAVVAVVYALLVLAFGATVLDTGRPWPAGTVALSLLAVLFLTALAGTVRLHDHAARHARGQREWQPDPWAYIVAGAAVLLLFRTLQFVVDGRIVSDPFPLLLGTAIVAVPMASLVAGPVYLLQCRRHS